MNEYYDTRHDRLVFEDRSAAEPGFWEEQWGTDFRAAVLAGGKERFVSPLTKRFLRPGPDVRVLEGGCGRGNNVYSLAKSGYAVFGIDYAAKTVALANKYVPELKITEGDVRNIPFPNNYFHGYWSLGVIEHFFDGYAPIADEMARVIRPGGFLFLVFPYISPLRRLKIQTHTYPRFQAQTFPRERFYQFALNDGLVRREFERRGFRLRYRLPYEGLKGLKDEVRWLRAGLQWMYDRPNLANRVMTYAISKLMAPVSSHTVLLVLQQRS